MPGIRKVLLMEKHVCPWWFAYSFDNPIRRLFHNPEKIFSHLVSEGQIAVDIGCGMGYFTLGLAKLVGPSGKVYAVDLQEKMLQRVASRARTARVQDHIQIHQCQDTSLGLTIQADFILTFWMVHEVPDASGLFTQILDLLKPGAHYLLVEPILHVKAEDFEKSVALASKAGLKLVTNPAISVSRAALFTKP